MKKFLPSETFNNETLLVSGWGLKRDVERSNNLLTANVKSANDFADCQKLFDNKLISDQHICVEDNNKEICKGDGGGIT
jgi:hypothetical protein